MKRFLVIAVTLFSLILVGCNINPRVDEPRSQNTTVVKRSQSAGEDKIIYASTQRSCTCIVNGENIDSIIDLMNDEKALMFYNVLMSSGEIFLITNDTRVRCYQADEYRGFVPVVFMEGEFKGRRAYVSSKRVQ